MRYYSIVLTNPQTGALISSPVFKSLGLTTTYTSFVHGQTLGAALDVELDIPVFNFAQPMGNGFVRIWGISLQEIQQSNDLNGAAVSVYAGMQKGLPLANPKQSGLIAQGYVLQALGNWVGNEMTLDLVITQTPTKYQPVNLSFNWKKGSKLSDAITQTLSTAYPGFSVDVKIRSDLVLTQDEPGAYQNLTQFAQYVKQRSAAILGGAYQGVDIQLTEKTFSVYDGTTQTTPKQLNFNDFIGQPTWIDPVSVQSKFVMRGDLQVGQYVQFPKNNAGVSIPSVTSANANNPFVNQKMTFQGVFQIKRVRHVGRYRQPDAASWVTVVDAASVQQVAA